jgi:FSR family fosmidomycin resistance protein-like MFS transporter
MIKSPALCGEFPPHEARKSGRAGRSVCVREIERGPEVSAPAQTENLASRKADTTVYAILVAISVSHLLNDTIQSLLPALYPILRESFSLSYTQIGLITLAFHATASLLQPVVGLYADHRPMPYSLSTGMAFTCAGVLLLAFAESFPFLLLAAAMIGLGSSIFHPESARVARMAAGSKPGFAQSFFQVGGNIGHSIGPLLAAFVIVVTGQDGIAWFVLIPLVGMIILWRVGGWYSQHVRERAAARKLGGLPLEAGYPRREVVLAVTVLLVLIFSKQLYMSSLTSYYTFYLIDVFGLPVPTAQIYLFFYLFAIAVGTLIGGSLSDRFGRKTIIWFSILGALPFALALPYADLLWTAVLTILIGMIMSSSLAVIIVFAQDLIPGKIGLVSGLFLGFAFGMSGVGALFIGWLADQTSLEFVYRLCSFIPMIGIITAFLPDVGRRFRF